MPLSKLTTTNSDQCIFLKGIGFKLLWFDFTLLILYAIGVFLLTSRKLRQKVA